MATTTAEVMEEVKSLFAKLNQRVDMLDTEQKKLGELLTSQSGQMAAEFKPGMERMNSDLDALMREFKNYQLSVLKPAIKGLAGVGFDSPTVKHEVKTAFIEAIRANARGDTYLD